MAARAPFIAAVVTGAFMVFAGPEFPGSPLACLNARSGPGVCHTNAQGWWLTLLVFGVPLTVYALMKTRRH
jgi:hypothetical protein